MKLLKKLPIAIVAFVYLNSVQSLDLVEDRVADNTVRPFGENLLMWPAQEGSGWYKILKLDNGTFVEVASTSANLYYESSIDALNSKAIRIDYCTDAGCQPFQYIEANDANANQALNATLTKVGTKARLNWREDPEASHYQVIYDNGDKARILITETNTLYLDSLPGDYKVKSCNDMSGCGVAEKVTMIERADTGLVSESQTIDQQAKEATLDRSTFSSAFSECMLLDQGSVCAAPPPWPTVPCVPTTTPPLFGDIIGGYIEDELKCPPPELL